jgi:hexosaminidase
MTSWIFRRFCGSVAGSSVKASLAGVALALAGLAGAQTLKLLPYPRQVARQAGELRLRGRVTISVVGASKADRFAASLLSRELVHIDRLAPRVERGAGGTLVLARADSRAGRRWLRRAGLVLPAEARLEGYALVVTPKRAVVIAAGAAGVFYGAETLRQLIQPAAAPGAAAATVPAVRIVDWPALRWRAVQMDVSRGPIPSLAALERDVPLFAELKINALVLYFENTFRYPDLPVWSAPGGAITWTEAVQVEREAARYHITVIPEQEAFGHLHLGLQEERYQGLIEDPYGALLSPAEPQSLALIGKMFADLDAAFPGPFFHIGADETAELGEGRSAGMLRAGGAGPLFLNYVLAIEKELRPYHRKILFWGDIAQRHPDLLKQLPKDMIAVPWDYGDRASFKPLIEPFTRAGVATWVAPGVSNWSRIFPDYNEALPNISRFVRDGRTLGATGIINTNWNDDGESFFDYCWYGIAYGGAAGWENVPSRARFDAAYDWAIFRARGHHFDHEIQELTRIHALLEHSPLHADGADRLMWHRAFSPRGQRIYGEMAPVAHPVRLLAEDVIASVAEHRAGARRNQELLDPVAFAARRFDFVGEKAIYARLIASLYRQAQAPGATRAQVYRTLGEINSINGWLEDMRDGVAGLRAQYRRLWLEGNTPYFLDDILVRYDAELLYWQRQTRRFDRISENYAAGDPLPPLVEASASSRP